MKPVRNRDEPHSSICSVFGVAFLTMGQDREGKSTWVGDLSFLREQRPGFDNDEVVGTSISVYRNKKLWHLAQGF